MKHPDLLLALLALFLATCCTFYWVSTPHPQKQREIKCDTVTDTVDLYTCDSTGCLMKFDTPSQKYKPVKPTNI